MSCSTMKMLCIAVALVCVATIQACPDPQTLVHIQNYDGPIIVHSSTCDNQHCNSCNQNTRYEPKQNNRCEPDCTCVTRNSYYPCTQTGSYPTTSYGCCNQYCKTDDVKIYPVVDNGYGSYGSCNRCGNNNYQYQCAGYYS